MADGPEEGVRHCDHGFLMAPVTHHAAIPRAERRVLRADGGQRALHQCGPEP